MSNIFSRRNLLIGAGVVGAAAVGGATAVLNHPGGATAPGVSRAAPVPNDETLPDAVDVVVIGGGNLGTATALTLAERGVSVALCEKGVIGGEASCRSFGLVENLGMHPIKLEMSCLAKSLWPNMNARTGHETGYQRTGMLMNFYSEEMRSIFEGWVQGTAGTPECDGRMIDDSERDRLIPGLTDKGNFGAIYQPSDGRAEPKLAAAAMAMGARAHGAKILQGCAVRGIERSAGKISAVVTEKGRINCKSVVLTGGSWSPLFLRSLDLDLPQFEVAGSVYAMSADLPQLTVATSKVAWRSQHDGNFSMGIWRVASAITPHLLKYLPQILPNAGMMLESSYPVFSAKTFWNDLTTPSHWDLDKPSPFEKNRILMPELAPDLLRETIDSARAAHPAFQAGSIVDTWAGYMSVTLDNVPVMGAVNAVPGLYAATGYTYGLSQAPAVGEVLADLSTGGTPRVDLSPYRFERFTDGSKVEFVP